MPNNSRRCIPLLSSILVILLFSATVSAQSPNSCLITNGSFETGTFQGWTVSGNGQVFIAIQGTLFSTGSDTRSIVFLDGNAAADVRSNGPGDVSSTGVLTSAPFILKQGRVSWLQLDETSSVAVAVNIVTPDGNTVLFPISPSGPFTGSWGNPNVAVPANLWGQQVAIQFRQHTTQQGSGWYTLIDKVCMDNVIFNFPPDDPSPIVNPSLLTRVLTHNYGTSSYPNNQTVDGVIKIQGRVLKGFFSNDPITLRVIDPQDPSPYITQNPNYDPFSAPDNKGGLATLSSAPNQSGSALLTISPNGDGTFEAYLHIPPSADGGDNYKIQASFDSSFPCGINCPTSGTITAWKRGYVEHVKMYKLGQVLTEAAGPCPSGDTSCTGRDPHIIHVKDASKFSVGETVHVFSAENSTTLVGEKPIIASIDKKKGIITLSGMGLQQTYKAAFLPGCIEKDNSLCADFPYGFIGKPSSGYFDSKPSATTLATAYNDTFTEWVIQDSPYFVPTWLTASSTNEATDQFIEQRSVFYFSNYDQVNSHPKTNFVQLVSASFSDSSNTLGGLTSASNTSNHVGSNWSWVFVDGIGTSVGGSPSNKQNAVDNDTAHELGHEWTANDTKNGDSPVCGPNEGPNCEHDGENRCQGTDKCLMNESRIRTLGVVRFHCNISAPSKDLFCIRGHVDDLNQDTCTWP